MLSSLKLLAVALIFPFAVATATAAPPSCASPLDPSKFSARGSQFVTGFLGQRLYLHVQHPDACSGESDGACKATAYVVSGDKLQVADECGAWTAAKFSAKSREAYGWVQSGRLADVRDRPTSDDVADFGAQATVPAFCSQLRDYFQATELEGRKLAAPFVSSQGYKTVSVPKDFVPAHNFEGDIGQVDLTEVTIDGISAKLARVRGVGMCSDEYTELWSANLGQYFGEAPGRRVSIDGKALLLNRDEDRIDVLQFHSNLNPVPVCTIAQEPRRPEQLSIAADVGLCEAVRRGNVEDVSLSEITPIAVEPESFGSTLKFDALNYRFIRRGRVDLANDGHVELVAMARIDSPPMGCGTSDFVLEWPVVLNEKGFPDVEAPVNKHSQDAGDEQARLIRYRGRIYVESRSMLNQHNSHRVSEVRPNGVKTMCSFTPVRYTVEQAGSQR